MRGKGDELQYIVHSTYCIGHTTANNSLNRNAQAQVHMCRVPFGFKWPSYSTSTIWTLRHFGDLHRSIGPYKFIYREHDLTLALCKVNYSRAKSIMKALTNFAIRDGRVRSAANIKQQNHQEIYDYVMPLLMQELYIEPHELSLIHISEPTRPY